MISKHECHRSHPVAALVEQHFDSSYGISLEEATVNATARDLVSCGLVPGVVQSSSCSYVHVTELVRWFREALGLPGKLNGELTSKYFSRVRGALDASVIYNVFF